MKYTVNSLETVTVENEEIVGIMENTKWNKEMLSGNTLRGNQEEGIQNSQQRILNEGLGLPYIRQLLTAKINGSKTDCEIVHNLSIAITFRY